MSDPIFSAARSLPMVMNGASRAAVPLRGAVLAIVALTGPALAAPPATAPLQLPAAADRAAQHVEPFGSYAVPTAPWANGTLQTVAAEGEVSLEAWQLDSSASTLELLAPLRDQLAAQGYAVLFECAAAACGGFDFRYQTEVLPEPEMHVDLADFRFLSASRPGPGADAPADYVTLLVSRTSRTGYVQIARVGPALPSSLSTDLITKTPSMLPTPERVDQAAALRHAPGLSETLEADGRAVLDDLNFETGSARLAAGDFASLDALAAYLSAHPDRRVTLVGHTDASGSLTANIALSRARARSVMQRLVEGHGIPESQVEADGVGYLMPLASNLTDTGRSANRRVEAVLTAVN